MIGGIDSQVQQRVEAYRGNPQGLAMKYQQNQELIDLLALQKLKSEKEAAAREIQMQMQGEPSTIADQREQQVAQLTQQEVAQKLMGSVPNMEQGIGALPGVQQSPMQGGGIASFQEGGEVTSFKNGGDVGDDEDELPFGIRAGQAVRGLPSTLIEQLIKANPLTLGALGALAGKKETAQGVTTDFLEGLLGLPEAQATARAPTQEPEVAAAPAPEEDFMVEQLPETPTTSATPTMAAPTKPEENEFLEMARKLMNVDPAEERRLEREAALKAFGYTDAELAQLREGLSPDERVWDRFKAFGRGAASGTSGLGALVGGSQASTQEMARQREALSGIVNANRAIREKAFGAGQPVYEQTSADRRQGISTGASELEGQRRAQTARDVAQYEAQTRAILENNKQLLELAKIDREAAIEIGAAAMESLTSGAGPYSAMYQGAVESFQNALKQADSRDESTRAAARDRIAQAQAQMEQAMDMTVKLMRGSSPTSGDGFGNLR